MIQLTEYKLYLFIIIIYRIIYTNLIIFCSYYIRDIIIRYKVSETDTENKQLIYNYPEQLFAAAGVMAIEHADFVGVERLALVTGGEISSTFDHPELLVKLGRCKLIEEVMIGEDTLIHFSGVDMGEACTIVLRGATQQILDEAERSLHDALCVLAQTVKETRTVFGGGCSEMLMAKAVSDLANHTPGKEAVAMESFAKALRMVRHTHPYVH
uniref:Chaperonin containing TCP1, subunit 2 (beta) n=1 Tax=Sinocyclocheilus rhinocerous TaxID=307959 RepID=A0A673MF76_9TELE